MSVAGTADCRISSIIRGMRYLLSQPRNRRMPVPPRCIGCACVALWRGRLARDCVHRAGVQILSNAMTPFQPFHQTRAEGDVRGYLHAPAQPTGGSLAITYGAR